MFGVTLEIIPHRWYNGVPGVGRRKTVMSETVAWIHDGKHLSRFLLSLLCTEATGAGMSPGSRVKSSKVVQERTQTVFNS